MNKNLRTICEGGVLIAAALVLSYLEIPIGVLGGSVSFVMLPLIVFALRHGAAWGIPAGLIFGLTNCLISGKVGYGLPSILLDYVLAYGAVGVAGFFGKMKSGTILGVFTACVARFAIHFISGVTIYAIAVPTAPYDGFALISSPVWFSIVYNGIYMLPSSILVLVVTMILHKALEKTPYALKRV